MRQIPSSLLYKPREILDPKIPSYHILAQLLVQLDHLQNIFILERLLLRQNMLDEGDLLVTSFEMVSLTLTFWSHKDRLLEARNDFEWLVSLAICVLLTRIRNSWDQIVNCLRCSRRGNHVHGAS